MYTFKSLEIPAILIPFLLSLTLANVNKDLRFNPKETGIDENKEDRVVGGVEAGKNEFPAIVHLMISKPQGTAFCGGNIINESWILTSAHCVTPLNDVSNINVTAGDHYRLSIEGTEQTAVVNRTFIHPSFDESTQANDIALLELKVPFTLNKYVAVATLANSVYYTQGVGIVAGWGRSIINGTVTNELRKATINFVSNPDCKIAYEGVYNSDIRDSTICAIGPESGIGPCNGDSGGPLMCSSASDGLFVCGLNSFVAFGSCGNIVIPSGFERVSSHIAWIKGYVPSIRTSSIQPSTTSTMKTTTTSQPGLGVQNLPSISVLVAILMATKFY